MTKVETRKKVLHKFLENPSLSGSLIAKSLEMHRQTVNRIIKRFNGSLSIDRQPAGRPKGRPRNKAAARRSSDQSI
jgi:predicted transcriptional regulator